MGYTYPSPAEKCPKQLKPSSKYVSDDSPGTYSDVKFKHEKTVRQKKNSYRKSEKFSPYMKRLIPGNFAPRRNSPLENLLLKISPLPKNIYIRPNNT